jgi:hypothetical protein
MPNHARQEMQQFVLTTRRVQESTSDCAFDSEDKSKILLSLFRLKHIVSKLAAGAQTTTVLPAALSGIVTFNSG